MSKLKEQLLQEYSDKVGGDDYTTIQGMLNFLVGKIEESNSRIGNLVFDLANSKMKVEHTEKEVDILREQLRRNNIVPFDELS